MILNYSSNEKEEKEMRSEEIVEKLKFFKENNKLIHIRCNAKRFYNGSILDINLQRKLMVLMDLRIGEVPILFEEIFFIEPMRDKE